MFKLLKDEEWRALQGLEKGSLGYGFTDENMISRLIELPRERVRFALSKLAEKGLVRRSGRSYSLTREGIEALALRDYVRRDLIAALGAVIGKGKESDVYEAVSEEGTVFALKFFKMGRVSFTRVRKKRFVDKGESGNWMTVNYEAAKREFASLRTLEGKSGAFPRPVAYNRSTVLLEQLSGVPLYERPELTDSRRVLGDILAAVRAAYLGQGLINGDLSEYNILTDGERVWIIDWPQAVKASHPNAKELLTRDVTTVLKFFRRAYGVEISEGSAMGYVEGKSESLE